MYASNAARRSGFFVAMISRSRSKLVSIGLREKYFCCGVELRVEPPPVALRTHNKRSLGEFRGLGFALGDLRQADAIIPGRLVQIRPARFHLYHLRCGHLDKLFGLVALVPVTEGFVWLVQLVENDQVFDILFQVLCPGQNAFNAARVRCHHADAGKLYALGCQLRVDVREPLISDSAAPSAHIGKDDVALVAERQIDQLVEAAPGMDVDFLGALVPEVQAAFLPVLGVEVGEDNVGTFGLVIVIEAQSCGGLSDSALTSLREYDSVWHCLCVGWLCVILGQCFLRVSGAFGSRLASLSKYAFCSFVWGFFTPALIFLKSGCR